MADDPFPRDRAAELLRRVPAYLRLAVVLAKDPALSKARRAAIIGAAGYLASPVDLVPGFIPVAGQLDDIAVAIAAIRFALAGLSPDRRRAHLEAVGLADDLLVDDLRTLGVLSAWIVRAGARTTQRAARAGASAASKGSRAAVRTGRTAATAAAAAAGAAASSRSRLPGVAAVAGPKARGLAARVPSPKDAAARAAKTARSATPGRIAGATKDAALGAARGVADAASGARDRAASAPAPVVRVMRIRRPALQAGPQRRPDELEIEPDEAPSAVDRP